MGDQAAAADRRPPLLSAGQNPNAGLLPPSDSDSDAPAGQNPRAGMLPSSSSDEEEVGGEGKAEKAAPLPPADGAAPAPAMSAKERKAAEAEAAANMERLALVRRRREEEREARIAAEGWDRYAPASEANTRPMPADHPSLRAKEGGSDSDSESE